MQKDPGRRRFPLADRVIEVIDDTLTGEVLLDEALKMMKASEKMSVSSWIDLMSGTSYAPCPVRLNDRNVLMCSNRRDVEPHENWIPIEASPRAISKRSG